MWRIDRMPGLCFGTRIAGSRRAATYRQPALKQLWSEMALALRSGSFSGALGGAWRRFARRLTNGGNGRSAKGASPERLLLAPPDLNTPDPTIAQEIHAGVFHFAGRSLNAGGSNPFSFSPPSAEWAGEMHGFSWLCHLGAARGVVSASNAQALVKDWIGTHPKPRNDEAWEPETAARRLIAWLCHSKMVVEDADFATYRLFLNSIGSHIWHLQSAWAVAPDGMARLVCLIALAYADVCVDSVRSGTRSAQKNLDTELARQIYADGGHVSRNPAVLCKLLVLLLPLRQAITGRGLEPSTELVSAIDRMMLALRFFRLGDGSIAHFNGVSDTPSGLVATLLRYGDAMGSLPKSLPNCGYQRLESAGTVVLMDTAKPPPDRFSIAAHAGTLSFEMSSGGAPILVNCGIPPQAKPDAVFAGRATAAHNTATLNDTSSSRLVAVRSTMSGREHMIAGGPSKVPVQRDFGDNAERLLASHDGYVRAFGLVHQRELRLASDGALLLGADRFIDPGGAAVTSASNCGFAIRFHLHPSVKVHGGGNSSVLMLESPGASRWKFTCLDVKPQLEESIFFATPLGARRSCQIVLHGNVSAIAEIRWKLARR